MAFDIAGENLVPTRTLAKIIKRDPDRVRQLEEEGLFTSEKKSGRKYFDLVPSVQAYIEYLRRGRENKENMDEESRKAKADADWKIAKAEIEEMKRDELKGMLHASEDVEKITTDLIMAIRSKLLAMPGTLAVDCAEAGTAREAAGVIKAAVNDALNGLAAYRYDPKKYAKLVREREKWMREVEEQEEE